MYYLKLKIYAGFRNTSKDTKKKADFNCDL